MATASFDKKFYLNDKAKSTSILEAINKPVNYEKINNHIKKENSDEGIDLLKQFVSHYSK